jgi:DNA topoisomerase-1
VFVRSNGARVTSARELGRIAALAIPPAWTDVWICEQPSGHLQVTGRDVRGRKQYRYHPRWRKVRDEATYHDILRFAAHLPALRATVERDLSVPGLTKRKVVAAILRIMERTSIRVGNDRYADENGSFGLTTLLDRHATIRGASVEFRFRGKGGKAYRASLRDRRLAAIVKRCRDLPGQRLFQYVDGNGVFRSVTSTDVNEYIERATGHRFTAKEFRTWAGTLSAILVLYERPPCTSATHARRVIAAAVDEVSRRLGNTRAICQRCYVHPDVFESYRNATLHTLFSSCLARARARAGLLREEQAVLAFFEELTAASARRDRLALAA